MLKKLILGLIALPSFIQAADRPNIVFILADDLGYADLACYGHPYARTPSLDKLASEGSSFRQFYVTGVTCCPSRTGFMTSRHPASFARYMSKFGFSGRMTVTELLKENGYRTGHFGKWHIGPDTANGTYGIDEIATVETNKTSPGGRDADKFEAAANFIEKNKDFPFYINIWGHITHFPVGPVPSLSKEFNDIKFDRKDFSENTQGKFDDAEKLGGNLAEGMRNYLGDVYSLDIQIGRLLKKIDTLGLRENTIVVFSSDHGPPRPSGIPGTGKNKNRRRHAVNMLGYAGEFRGGKHTQYEGGVRSPFIVRWPGHVPANRINDTSVFSALDWLPTICHLAGVDIDARSLAIEGENVADIWLGSERSRKQPLFWKRSADTASPAIRDGKWKFHAFHRREGPVALYELNTDPAENHNVAQQHPGIVKRLTTQLNQWTATLPKRYLTDRTDTH